MLLTSNIKEYIQGCISVLFSYKIGNVFWSLQGRSSLCLPPRFCFARQLPESITAPFLCQRIFYIFLRKILESVKHAADIQISGDKKMKRTILSITSVHFIFLSGERGIWTLAPVLPTYSLSRGAPSASWVFLQKDTYQCGICNLYNTKKCL